MPRKNDWASRFGAARRAIDRRYLAEAERAIADEERRTAAPRIEKLVPPIDFTERDRIARAFGRPITS